MSTFVDEVVWSLDHEAELWAPVKGNYQLIGVKKGNLSIVGFGNSRLFSIIELKIDGLRVHLAKWDAWKLESATLRWYENSSLIQLGGSNERI